MSIHYTIIHLPHMFQFYVKIAFRIMKKVYKTIISNNNFASHLQCLASQSFPCWKQTLYVKYQHREFLFLSFFQFKMLFCDVTNSEILKSYKEHFIGPTLQNRINEWINENYGLSRKSKAFSVCKYTILNNIEMKYLHYITFYKSHSLTW